MLKWVRGGDTPLGAALAPQPGARKAGAQRAGEPGPACGVTLPRAVHAGHAQPRQRQPQPAQAAAQAGARCRSVGPSRPRRGRPLRAARAEARGRRAGGRAAEAGRLAARLPRRAQRPAGYLKDRSASCIHQAGLQLQASCCIAFRRKGPAPLVHDSTCQTRSHEHTRLGQNLLHCSLQEQVARAPEGQRRAPARRRADRAGHANGGAPRRARVCILVSLRRSVCGYPR